MAYGTIKVNNITFDDGGSDQTVTVSGLYNSLTSGITVTGTISGAVVIGSTSVSGTTVAGVTVTGTTVQGASGTFTSLTGTTTQGTTATYTTGSFTSLTGTTTTGTTSSFTSGVFTTLSGATATFTSGIIASGTAAAPSLAILGDPNTGIFSPGADQVAVATNGTGRLFIDSTGQVGIGTSTPNVPLEVVGNIHMSGAADRTIFNRANNALSLGTNNTTRLHITNAGLVGIGTTSPGQALDVVGDAQIGPVSGSGTLLLGVRGFSASLRYNGSTGDLDIAPRGGFGIAFKSDSAGTTERARIDSSGRLLVGTSSASTTATAVFQGNSGGSTSHGIVNLARGATNPGINLSLGFAQFQDAAGSVGAQIYAQTDAAWSAGSYAGRLVFSTTADGASSPTERMRITSSGDVQIGTVGTEGVMFFRRSSDGNAGAVCGLVSGTLTFVNTSGGGSVEIGNGAGSGASIVSLKNINTEMVRLASTNQVYFPTIGTTASAANAFLNSGSSPANQLLRSTSSLRYKTDIENIEDERSDAILDFRPVWYRSTAEADRNDWSWYGLIAEEVAAVEPRLVHWTYLDDAYEEVDGEKQLKPDAEMVPDGVQYDRLTVLLLDVVKRQQQAIETLEAKVAALEGV
jgi:hypothetical protein